MDSARQFRASTVSDPKLYQMIVTNECRNTHHKLVMNSLKRLQCEGADQWLNLFVRYFEQYLEGSKDPDTKFKDFRNHVLHVSDNYWGGAAGKTEKWYQTTVEHLKNEKWRDAVYSAGVMSHYYMDPIMPLHTGQTEQEGVIHRACEWSINKSFDSLIELLESTTGYPTVTIPTGNDWIKSAVHQGAEFGHVHYQTFIDHYNIKLGSKNPPAGLDSTLREISAQLLGFASVGFARILERAIEEAAVGPAKKSSGFLSLLYQVTIPISWSFKAFRHFTTRSRVKKIAAEYEAHGKVVKALPKDEKLVRAEHAAEILKVDLAELDKQPIEPVGTKSTAVEPTKSPKARSRKRRLRSEKNANEELAFRLELAADLEKAPSIGPKTAKRFKEVDILTVSDFLNANAETTALALNVRHIDGDTIRQWQTQARLACEIPKIHGHDAQILAGCGFENAAEVASTKPKAILSLVGDYVKTDEAKFVIRDGQPPDLDEVTNWVTWSKQGRSLKAA